MLALFALLLAQPPIEGLRPGESARELAPALAAPDPGLHHGRVVDALTGRPLAGATIETWTEEIDATFGGFHRIGEAVTGVDGRFAVPGAHAAKVRILAPGYATLSAVPSDLTDVLELFPAPPLPVRLRVVDTEDRPISGARITTTWSCAHDVPAFDVRSDAAGEVRLPAFGLQENVPVLRVRAAGYRAIKELNPRRILASPQPWLLRLMRYRGAAATVLDQAGTPVADTALVVHDGDGEHVVRTDATGHFALPSLYLFGDLRVSKLEAEGRSPAFLLGSWRDATLRLDSSEWPADQPVGEIGVTAQPPAGEDVELPPIRVLHERGWSEEYRFEEAFRFPAGRVRIAIGGPFTGFAESVTGVEVRPGELTEVELGVEREPRVTVRVPDDTHETWIETDETSFRMWRPEGPVSVPAGRPLTFYAHTRKGHHLLRYPAARDGMVVDLTGDDSVVHRIPKPERGSMIVSVSGAPAGELCVTEPFTAMFEVTSLDRGRYRLEGPAGVPFFVRWRAKGFAVAGIGGVLEAGAEPTRTLEPVPFASLAIESAVPHTLVGMEDLKLTALHPGPLRFVIALAGGRRLGVALDLAPGEARQLRVR